MIQSVSIIFVWILVVEAGRIILSSGSADADKGNSTAEKKWNDEIDNDDGFANENFQDNDVYKDKIIEWKDNCNDKERLISNDESQNDNSMNTEIVINNTNSNGSNCEKVSKRQEDDEIDEADDCSTEEANAIDYPQSIFSTPKDHTWVKKRIVDENFDAVIKTNVKRVKRLSRAGNSRKVKIVQERHNNRFDNSSSSEKNQNHRKYKVSDN
ncbi:hypothetical protein X798_04596 [Onchocerca flexuosa]|uniref:Uncharacterized protein n=1 Tax=Onchocerca flexuosa TaxID=387005 RepID=A0A238BU15_9BILA|nr:hypothetical protein X798_04596 [Onchocerca flexuosa]